MADPLARQLLEAAERCEDEGEVRLAKLLREAHAALATAGRAAETPQWDAAMMALAMYEWARLIRLAEDQQTLSMIAEDIEVNASALSNIADPPKASPR